MSQDLRNKESILRNSGFQTILASLLCIVLGLLVGFIILAEETAWDRLGGLNAGVRKKTALLWGIRYGIFNLLYLPAVLFFQKLLFAGTLSLWVELGVLAAGRSEERRVGKECLFVF